jgi:hypothetical protein
VEGDEVRGEVADRVRKARTSDLRFEISKSQISDLRFSDLRFSDSQILGSKIPEFGS